MNKITFACPNCGSSELLRDAFARWSDEAQEWVLFDVYAAIMCRECDETFCREGMVEKELTDEEAGV